MIRIRGTRIAGEKIMMVRLKLVFKPEELGRENTSRLLTGLVRVVAAVSSPEECAELVRLFEAEKARLRGKPV
jgi:hypothetical protein